MSEVDLTFIERLAALAIVLLPWLVILTVGAGLCDWLEARDERRRASLNHRPIAKWSRQ